MKLQEEKEEEKGASKGMRDHKIDRGGFKGKE